VKYRSIQGATAWLVPALLTLLSAPARATMPPHSGPLAPELAQAFEQGLFAVPPQAQGLGTSAVRNNWAVPIIRVAFTDSAIVYPKVAMEERLFDTTGAVPTGSMTQYYTWASGRRITVRGEVVATVTLPHPRNYYAADAWGVNVQGTPENDYGLFRDAIAACDDQVDFSRFDLDNDGYVDMLWVVHAGPGGDTTSRRRDLWSITSRATAGWNNGVAVTTNDFMPGSFTQHVRIDRFTILPELSGLHPGALSEIGVFCHEFGHTLGLPDLYDTSVLGGTSNVGPGYWSLMSTGAFGGDGQSPESPSGFGAWCMQWLGWSNRIRPTQDTTLVLPPAIDGAPLLEFSFQGEASPEHFLVENRIRESFDRHLPNDGLLVSQVDDAMIGSLIGANRINTGPTPGLRILEADGNFDMYHGYDRGDANDPFPGGVKRTHIDDLTTPSTRTFLGAPTNIALEDITRSGRNVSVRVRVRAPGWNVPHDLAPGAPEPVQSFGAATRAVVSANGDAWQVSSEPVGGRLAVVLRSRPWLQAWQPAQVVDRGSGISTDPTLALVGAGDLAVAWVESDGSGPGQVCYRARVRGHWAVPHVLTSSPEGCLAPAIAADARGRVYLSWLESVAGRPRLRFLQFLYGAPYGQPVTVTIPDDLPTPPTVTAAGNGHAYLLWSNAVSAPDGSNGPLVAVACRFNPDSGLSARFRLTPESAPSQPSLSAVVDSNGVLYSVWQVSPGAGSEIHFQRRQPAGRPSMRDTTLDALGDALQNPRIALDPAGGIHVAYERSVAVGQRVRYKLWRPTLGWDNRATEISDEADLTSSHIELLPTSIGNVTVLWTGYDGVALHLRVRDRNLDGSLVTAVQDFPEPRAPGFIAGPNPLRAGQPLEFSGARLRAGDVVELVDASGRRVAVATADARGIARLERGETRALPPGLYFAGVRGGEARGRVVVLR
jgi:immune inhibitor A